MPLSRGSWTAHQQHLEHLDHEEHLEQVGRLKLHGQQELQDVRLIKVERWQVQEIRCLT